MKKLKAILLIAAALVAPIALAARFQDGGLLIPPQEITSSGGTTVLSTTSAQVAEVRGTQNHTVRLPDATDVHEGWFVYVVNNSTGTVTVTDDSSNVIGAALSTGQTGFYQLLDDTLPIGRWSRSTASSSGGGPGIVFSDLSATAPVIYDGAGNFSFRTFTPGSILFANTSMEPDEDNANLNWDSASQKLHIGVQANFPPGEDGIEIENTNGTALDETGFLFKNLGYAGSTRLTSLLNAGGGTSAMRFYTGGTPSTLRMILDENGDLYGATASTYSLGTSATHWLNGYFDNLYVSGTFSPAPGSIDHGGLGGLSDDDHPQYVSLDGRNAPSGQTILGGRFADQDVWLRSNGSGTPGNTSIGENYQEFSGQKIRFGNFFPSTQPNYNYEFQMGPTQDQGLGLRGPSGARLWDIYGDDSFMSFNVRGDAGNGLNVFSTSSMVGVGSGTPAYKFMVSNVSTDTTPASMASDAPVVSIRARSATNGNYSAIVNENQGTVIDSQIVGVHDNHSGVAQTGHIEFYTANAGSIAKWLEVSNTGVTSLDGAIATEKRDESSAFAVNDLATTQSLVKITATVSDINGATNGQDGKRLTIHNDKASGSIWVTHENSLASAVDRFTLPGATSMEITNEASAEFFYDSGDSRWKLAETAAGSGGSGITQLTGDVTAGPGSGSQVATIANGVVTQAKASNQFVFDATTVVGTSVDYVLISDSSDSGNTKKALVSDIAAATVAGGISEWQSYTPTFAGLGTVTSINFFYRRVGDSLDIRGWAATGTNTGSQVQIGLPAGLSVDTTKCATTRQVGWWGQNTTSLTTPAGFLMCSSGNTYLTLGKGPAASTNPFTELVGTDLINSTAFGIDASGIPIEEFD